MDSRRLPSRDSPVRAAPRSHRRRGILRAHDRAHGRVAQPASLGAHDEIEALASQNQAPGFTANWKYRHLDGLGNLVKTVNASGVIISSVDYDAFGNGGTVTGYGFTGREFDPETGLIYYRARYYDPKIGRFISEDPIGQLVDVNVYRYVSDNPVNRIDPTGLQAMSFQEVWNLTHGHNASGQSTALIVCLIWNESSFDPNAVNGTAVGLMGIQPPAAKDVGGCPCERKDPVENVVMGTNYLRTRIQQFGVTGGLNHFGTGSGYSTKILQCEKCFLSCSSKDPFDPSRNAYTCLRLIHK